MSRSRFLEKPVLNVSKTQWKSLLSRIFERESKTAKQFGETVGQPTDAEKYGLQELQRFQGSERELSLMGSERKGIPRPPAVEPLPGHVMGGEARGQMAKYDVRPNPPEHGLAGAIADAWGSYEEPVGVARRWKSGMEQSEEMARAVAEKRGLKFSREEALTGELEELIPGTPREDLLKIAEKQLGTGQRRMPEFKRGPTPSKKGKLKERRGIKSSLADPGALLPEKMKGPIEKGGYLPTAAELMSFKPPETVKHARLIMKEGGEERLMTLPWSSAMRNVYKYPQKFQELPGKHPPIDIMDLGEGGPLYERRIFHPVKELVERASKAAAKAKKELAEAAKAKAQEEALKSEKGRVIARIRKGGEKSTISHKITQEVDPDRLFTEAAFIDQVWKDVIGNRRTVANKTWRELMAEENRRHPTKQVWTDPRDYFQYVFLKYLHEPQMVEKRYRREAGILEKILKTLDEEHGIFKKD